MNHSFKSACAAFFAMAAAASAQAPTGIQDAIPQSAQSLAERTGQNWTGNTKYDGWYNLTVSEKTRVVDGVSTVIAGNTGYPSVFGSAAAFPSPIASQVKSGTSANFNKVANGNGTGGLDKFNADGTRNATTWNGTGMGPYPAGDSLYAISFSNVYNAKGGTLGIFETNPVLNLSSVVFQVEIGSANGYDFYESSVPSDGSTPLGTVADREVGALDPNLGKTPGGATIFPALNLTFADNSTATLYAGYAELVAQGVNGTMPMPTGPNGEMVDENILINLYGFQWDLSEYEDIASFNITFDVVEHTQTYAFQLDQSDTFTQVIASIPEPSVSLLGMMGALGLLRRRR